MEELNYGLITALKDLKEEIDEKQSAFDEMAEPRLKDWNLLPKLYEIFLDTFPDHKGIRSVNYRLIFIFVVMYLYAPASLAGNWIPRGFRQRIAKLFNLNCSTPISDNVAVLDVYYKSYVVFRKNVDKLYSRFMEYLNTIEPQEESAPID